MDKTDNPVYAPVYIVNGLRFIFAYQDQVFVTKEEASARGYVLGKELKDSKSGAKFTGDVVNITTLRAYHSTTIPVVGWKVVFIPEEVKKKHERRRRAKGSV